MTKDKSKHCSADALLLLCSNMDCLHEKQVPRQQPKRATLLVLKAPSTMSLSLSHLRAPPTVTQWVCVMIAFGLTVVVHIYTGRTRLPLGFCVTVQRP